MARVVSVVVEEIVVRELLEEAEADGGFAAARKPKRLRVEVGGMSPHPSEVAAQGERFSDGFADSDAMLSLHVKQILVLQAGAVRQPDHQVGAADGALLRIVVVGEAASAEDGERRAIVE